MKATEARFEAAMEQQPNKAAVSAEREVQAAVKELFTASDVAIPAGV